MIANAVVRVALEAGVKAMCHPPCRYPKCVAEPDLAEACRYKARHVQAAIVAFLHALPEDAPRDLADAVLGAQGEER